MGLGSWISSACSAVCNFCSSFGSAIIGGIGSLAPAIVPWIAVAVKVIAFLAEIFTENRRRKSRKSLV